MLRWCNILFRSWGGVRALFEHGLSYWAGPGPTDKVILVACPMLKIVKSTGEMKKVPAMLRGNFWPLNEEKFASGEALKVVFGALPEGLEGNYVRNGPNISYELSKGQAYHFFDGDGFLHQIVLDGEGNASNYRCRWVETERWVENRQKGGAIYPIGETMRGNMDPMINVQYPDSQNYSLMKGTANTAVIYHAGRLLALHEGDHPYELEPGTMDTLQRLTWEGQLKHRFTAHPKLCPRTGELIFFGANPVEQPFMHYSVADAAGNLTVNGAPVHGLRAPVVMHDIAITHNFSIVLDFPLLILSKPKIGKSPYFHDTSMPTRFGVMPRHFAGGSEANESIRQCLQMTLMVSQMYAFSAPSLLSIPSLYPSPSSPLHLAFCRRWFEASSCFVYHMANAWESADGKIITLIGCRSPHMVFCSIPVHGLPSLIGSTHVPYPMVPYLWFPSLTAGLAWRSVAWIGLAWFGLAWLGLASPLFTRIQWLRS